jgi:hypothetical protein
MAAEAAAGTAGERARLRREAEDESDAQLDARFQGAPIAVRKYRPSADVRRWVTSMQYCSVGLLVGRGAARRGARRR